MIVRDSLESIRNFPRNCTGFFKSKIPPPIKLTPDLPLQEYDVLLCGIHLRLQYVDHILPMLQPVRKDQHRLRKDSDTILHRSHCIDMYVKLTHTLVVTTITNSTVTLLTEKLTVTGRNTHTHTHTQTNTQEQPGIQRGPEQRHNKGTKT